MTQILVSFVAILLSFALIRTDLRAAAGPKITEKRA